MRKHTFALRTLAAMLLAGTTTLAAQPPAAAAITGCPYASGGLCYAVGRFFQYDNLHAIGANLSVDCLAVGNRATDFANFTMWIKTRVNLDVINRNWVEAGMTSGTLWSSPGDERGFLWYWADGYGGTTQRYYEHYISGATANTAVNVTFRWEGNDTWGVYKGGTRVSSSGVGPYPGNADIGGETTSYESAIWGTAVDWQYMNKSSTWSWINATTPLETQSHWLRVEPGYGSQTSPTRGWAIVNTWSPLWHCGAPPPHPYDFAPKQALSASTDSLLRTTVDRVVAAVDGKATGDITYVTSSRNVAASRVTATRVLRAGQEPDTSASVLSNQLKPTADVPDDRPVIVAQVRGQFAKTGHDRTIHGTVLEVVVDAATGQLTDWGISADTGGIAKLGSVRTLSR